MTHDQIASLIQEHAAELRARGVIGLGVFGSMARGDAGADSDIDIVIDVAPQGKFSLIDLAGLRVFLCELFRHQTDVVIRDDLRPDFRKAVDRETVRLL